MSIKRKKRAVPITPQNELPNGQFSVELFTYLEKKIQVKLSTLLGQAICALTNDLSFASTETVFINPKTKTQNNFLVNTRILVKLFQKKPK